MVAMLHFESYFAYSLGMTALHHACIWGNTNIVETILKYHQGWATEELGYAHNDMRVYHVVTQTHLLQMA